MDHSVFMAAAKVFAACFAVALFAWGISSIAIGAGLKASRSGALKYIENLLVARLSVGFGLHRGDSFQSPIKETRELALKVMDFVVEWRLLLVLWLSVIVWGVVSEPGHLTDYFMAAAYGTFAIGMIVVVSFSGVKRDWVACWTLVALTACSWMGFHLAEFEFAKEYSDWELFRVALLPAVAIALLVLLFSNEDQVWRVFFACVLPIAVAGAYFNQAAGERFIAAAHWISIAFGTLLLISIFALWRQYRNESLNGTQTRSARAVFSAEPFHKWGINFEFCLALGFAGFLAVYLLHMLDRDIGLFEASDLSKANVYLLFLWNTVVEQIPILGRIVDETASSLGLPGWANTAGKWVGLAFAQGADWFLSVLALMAGLSAIALAFSATSRQNVDQFGEWVRTTLKEKVLADTVERISEAAFGGRAFLQVATHEADKFVSQRVVPTEFDPWQRTPSGDFAAPVLGYFVTTSKETALMRRRFLNEGSGLVREHLYRRTRQYWPALLNHQAVSSSVQLAEIVRMLRASVAEWTVDRAPANFASTMNLLGIELSRLVAQQWDDEQAVLGELADILDEAAVLLRRAVSVFENLLPATDMAAVCHNLGVVEFMLGRIRHDPVQAQSAVRNIQRALNEREGQFGGPSEALEMDAAASNLYLALSYGLLSRINTDDAHSVDILLHCTRSIALYLKNAGRIVSARENLIVAYIHSANLAMQLGHWNLALKYLFQAKRHSELPELNGASTYRFGIFVRYAIAALRLAQKEIEKLPYGGGSARERVRRNLQRGQVAISTLARVGMLETRIKNVAKKKEAGSRQDVRSVFLLAGYYVWVRTESELTFDGGDLDLVPSMNSITELLQVGLDWDASLSGDIGKDDEEAEKKAVAGTAKEVADHITGIIGAGE